MPSSSLEELLVYGRPSSLNAQKVYVICEECDVQFELKFASAWLKPGENVYPSDKDKDSWNTVVKTEEYHALNPNPTVPTVLLKDGQALWESNTIVRYIARKCKPELAGGSSLEKAAIIEKWMDWQLAQGEKALAVLHNNVVRNPENKRDISVIATSAEQVATWLLKVVERQLEVTSYLGGDEFTVADIPLGIIVCRWKGMSRERIRIVVVTAERKRKSEKSSDSNVRHRLATLTTSLRIAFGLGGGWYVQCRWNVRPSCMRPKESALPMYQRRRILMRGTIASFIDRAS